MTVVALRDTRTHLYDIALPGPTNPIVMMVNTPASRSDDVPKQPQDTDTPPEDTQGTLSPESQPSTEPSHSSRLLTETTSGTALKDTGSPPDIRSLAGSIASRSGHEPSHSNDSIVGQARSAGSGELPGLS
jgi:hypothetical protein